MNVTEHSIFFVTYSDHCSPTILILGYSQPHYKEVNITQALITRVISKFSGNERYS